MKDFGSKWREKTDCRDGFTTTDCKNGPKPTPTPTAGATGAAPQATPTATPAQ